MKTPLKLIAQNSEDITVVSALLQDMTVRIGDIAWLASEHRFAFIGNRFRWEKKRMFRRPRGERVRTAVHFSGVKAARLTGFNLKESDRVLALLHIEMQEQDSACHLQLMFAEGALIQIEADTIDAVVTDISESWQAINRPSHD